jgi:hypothetical protein
MNEQRQTTHVLVVEVQLYLDDEVREFDPVKDALHITLAVSRAAFVGSICGDTQVELREAS